MLAHPIAFLFIIFLCLNLLGILFLGGLRIFFIKNSNSTKHKVLKGIEPFVSIHLAICNEPPDMVLKTLYSFKELHYSNYEVIIISNNSTNTKSWKPIQLYCLEHDEFKFYHFDKVSGFKAGALNIALQKTSTLTEYIFTVDSDYQLQSDALKIAVGTIIDRNVDLIQFPQDYQNICDNTSGLQINYKHYFECYLSAMDHEKYGLPTGTLTLIKFHIFQNDFVWPTSTITEDAHFGLELLSRNFKIGYCNKSIGLGTMPTNIEDYSKQYKRWIFGNFQTLILSFRKRNISFGHKLRLFTMLSAWINLLAVPIVLTFAAVPLFFFDAGKFFTIYFLITLSIFSHLVVQIYLFRITSKNSILKTFKALLVHIGTIEIGSFHWITYFRNNKQAFNRTNKFILSEKSSVRFFMMPILLFTCSIIYLLFDFKVVGLALMVISIVAVVGKLQLVYELFHSKYNFSKIFRL